MAAAAVLCLVLLVAGISTVIWRTYFTHHPLWVEHAAYGMWANVDFHDALVAEGYRPAFRRGLGTRHVLQPALLGLVSPALLASPHSHLLVVTGTLGLFLALLVRFVRERTGSRFLGLGAAVLFCTLGGLYDERNGMGAPWPDYQAMFLLSSAALSLGLYAVSARAGWLALAGGFVSLAALARDTAAVYAAVICVPILVLLLLNELRNGRRLPAVMWRGLFCAMTALPAMLLLASKIAWFRQYYMTANVAQLRQPLATAASNIWDLFADFSGVLPLVGSGLLVAGALAVWPRRQWSPADVVVVCWPVAFFLFLAANGYTSDVTKEVMYMAPGVVCAAVTLGGGVDMRSRYARAFVSFVLAVCAIGAGTRAVQAYDRARRPDERAAALRVSQRAVADALASIPQRVAWHSYSQYDWGTVVSALTFYEFGRHQPTENRWFHNRKNYWDANFPGMDLPELQEHIFTKAQQNVDVAIVLRDSDRKPDGMEDYSYSIASHVARRVETSPEWKHYRDVHTSVSGPLSLYVNLRRASPAASLGATNPSTP